MAKSQSSEESLVFYCNKQTDIYLPIKNSQRVKYTCFHVCPSYVAFGSSSGGLYLFSNHNNNQLDYLFTILNSSNCGPISCVSFAPHDDHLIAMATSRGHLMVAQIQSQKDILLISDWNIIYQCNGFTKHSVNILKWDQYYDYRLYISDKSGQIFILDNVKDLKNLMVVPQPSIILKLMSEVYELEVCMDLLLLSTLSKCILYDVSTGELTQIGKKSVRSDGQSYGVCFFRKANDIECNDNPIYDCIYCSRPKSRLWESDLKGNVRYTHQFKELLINQMPQKIINGDDICCANNTIITNEDYVAKESDSSSPSSALTPTFAKLCVMNIEILGLSLIVALTNCPNVCLYLINPINACIVSYCVLELTNIKDIYCIDSDIYIIYKTSEDKRLEFRRISCLTPEQCLKLLIGNNEFKSGANLVINQMEYFTENYARNQFSSELSGDKLLAQLWSNLKSEDKQEFGSIEQLIIKRMSREKSFLIDKTQEFLLNSIEFNASDVYNRQSERLYFDINSQYNDSTTIDAVDVGFAELRKLKDVMLSKLNTKQIDSELNLSSDSQTIGHEIQLEYNNNCLEENNQINSFQENNSSDDNKRHELELDLQQIEIQLKSSQILTQYKCDCDSPLPDSHHRLTQLQNTIQTLLEENMDLMSYSVIDLMDISKTNAIWPLYMQLLLKCQEYNKYLKSSLMLNDVKLLSQTEFIQNYLFSYENFRLLLKLFSQQRDIGNDLIVRCIECNKSLTDVKNSIKWETIIRFCINKIGVEEAISLLNEFLDRKPVFSVEFYLFLLRIRMISANQSPITREKLNKLIKHLNNATKLKTPNTSSSVTNLVVSSASVTPIANNNQNQCKGFKINISQEKCAKCDNPFTRKGQKTGHKLIAFYCKHIYHKSCLNSYEKHCVLCLNNSKV